MRHFKFLFLSLFFTAISYAQVGIGTLEPHASAMLDIQSNSQGLLAPRMTTAERTAIASPGESLLVYDTDEKAFYFYSTTWKKLANDASSKRDNYKLIKSVEDLAPELLAGGSASYKLDSDTYYEINGTINLAKPIDLNNAFISGMDTSKDILLASGTIFKGTTGGSIRNVTLKGGKAFDITGPGVATNSFLYIQNTIIDGMTTSVGQISNFGLFFGNIVQFMNNNNGITYSNIGNLLLSNQGWLSSNQGTFEKFTGGFGLIEKVSGFSTVSGSAVAVDVSAIAGVGTGILQGTVFSGTTSASSGYIKGYVAASTYDGYNFSNAWTVDAPGIPREGDGEATGDINLSTAVGSGASTTFSGTGTSSRKKLNGVTSSNNLFRFTKDGNNKITYRGNKTRYFQVAASVSYQSKNDLTVILYIAKNGLVITETKVYGRGASGFFVADSGILALPLIGTVQLKTNDTIEIWAERYSGNGDMETISLNLIAK